MFLQIHTLTSYHASLLNRDDAGLAKRLPFGDKPRLRVSSQCLKRHWRDRLHDTVKLPQGIRSRQFFGRIVLPGLLEASVDEALARALVKALIDAIIDGGVEDDGSLALKQPVLFGQPEADFLLGLLKECAGAGDEKAALEMLKQKLKTDKKNFKAMLKQAGYGDLYAGLEGALFGRFVTSDILARSDAAVHVAHAFTVHGLDTEVDYFTVVDDLNKDDETGAAHAGDMELGAGLYYGYVAVDIPLLVSNLTGCDVKDWARQNSADAREVLAGLVEAIATVSPGAKLGSTAPYAYSDFLLLEAGDKQPRGLANAYLQALPAKGDVMQSAVDALGRYLADVDAMYGPTASRRAAATRKAWPETAAPRQPLGEAVNTILDAVFGA